MSRWTSADVPDLTGRRAIVTGGASGIGFESARALAAHGAEVLLLDRNQQKGNEALQQIRAETPNVQVSFESVDLSDLAAIRKFADDYRHHAQSLDLLLNIAGILPPPQRHTNSAGQELAFAIGVLGHYALTGLLFDALQRAPAARVVSISSIVHPYGKIDFADLQLERNYSSQRSYQQTKLASLMFGLELQRCLSASGSKILSVAAHPGIASTRIGADHTTGPQVTLRDRIEQWAMKSSMRWLGQNAEMGALPVLYAATAADIRPAGYYGPGGWRELKGPPNRAKIAPVALDAALAKKLWTVCEDLTGIAFTASRE